VRLGRLRAGELLAGAGAAALFVALFLAWFGPGGRSGWDRLGWLVLALAAAAAAAGGWLVFATVAARPLTQVVSAAVVASTIAPMALLALLLRTLVFQPGPNELATVRYGAWVGLVGAAALGVGAWWALSDERTDAPESAYEPPPARPAPPSQSS
jgi:drug/metabolite transporter (DMT)-like permease